MKDYKEVAESVFRRSEEVIARNKRRRRAMIMNGSAALCIVAAGAVWFGVWRSSANGIEAERYASGSGESAAVSEHEYHAASGESIIGSEPNLPPPDYPSLDGESSSAESAYDPETCRPVQSETDGCEDIVVHLPMMKEGESVPDLNGKLTRVISDYEVAETPKYAVPENGQVSYSYPLRCAMDEWDATCALHGNKIVYHVAVVFFKDGVRVDANSPEIREDERSRIYDMGIITDFPVFYDNGEPVATAFGMTLDEERIKSFVPSGEYGYMFFLYDESAQTESGAP